MTWRVARGFGGDVRLGSGAAKLDRVSVNDLNQFLIGMSVSPQSPASVNRLGLLPVSLFDCQVWDLPRREGYLPSTTQHMSKLPLIRPPQLRTGFDRMAVKSGDLIATEAAPTAVAPGGRKGGFNDIA